MLMGLLFKNLSMDNKENKNPLLNAFIEVSSSLCLRFFAFSGICT